MSSIVALNRRVHVASAVAQLAEHDELWDRHTLRTTQYNSPHGVSDIWVRYNSWENYTGDHADFNGPHVSVWYDAYDVLTELRPIIGYVYGLADGASLGGVLITKVSPGGKVLPHVDHGWHAEYYQKYGVQLKGNKDHQVFGFEDSELRPEAGDIYTFNNQKLHWVNNDSEEDRITLIVCIHPRTEREKVLCLGQ